MFLKITVASMLILLAHSTTIRIHPRSPIEEEVAGIIMTISDGFSFDPLFTSVTQKTKRGSVVLTYTTPHINEGKIVQALQGQLTGLDPTLVEFVTQVEQLSRKCPSCVVFNWECSRGFEDEKFEAQGLHTFALLDIIIKKGFLGMLSDFSLKALINQWNSTVLGPNPFKKVGYTNQKIQLSFDRSELQRSPLSQLQALAQLAQTDTVIVDVSPRTIRYGVDSRVNSEGKYNLEVLTVASNFNAPHPYLQSSVNEHRGLAGHVLLTYGQGGSILTSMGHWIQLMEFSTSKERVIETASKIFGQEEAEEIKKVLKMKTEPEQILYLQMKSIEYIQEQSPGQLQISQEQQNDL